MAKWNYDLKINGAELKGLIDKDEASQANCVAILNQIIVCCKWLQTNMTDDDKDCYEWNIEDMIDECEDVKCYLDEFDWESNEDNINDSLDNFYDLMDEMRVWIGA